MEHACILRPELLDQLAAAGFHHPPEVRRISSTVRVAAFNLVRSIAVNPALGARTMGLSRT
jgi:hypothetical protein